MVPKLLSDGAPESLRDEVRGWILEQPAETVVADLQALRDRPDSRPDLPAIQHPTLVLVGSADVLTPPAESEAMAAAIPNSQLSVVEGAGHLSPVERAEAVAGRLSEFLKGV
jgi:pimeloyl-ACP methyl ester carboxylesterase